MTDAGFNSTPLILVVSAVRSESLEFRGGTVAPVYDRNAPTCLAQLWHTASVVTGIIKIAGRVV